MAKGKAILRISEVAEAIPHDEEGRVALELGQPPLCGAAIKNSTYSLP